MSIPPAIYRGAFWRHQIDLPAEPTGTLTVRTALIPPPLHNAATSATAITGTVEGTTLTLELSATATADLLPGVYGIEASYYDTDIDNRTVFATDIEIIGTAADIRTGDGGTVIPPTLAYTIYTGATASATTPSPLTSLTAHSVTGNSIEITLTTLPGGVIWIITPDDHPLTAIHNNLFSADDALAAFTMTQQTIGDQLYNLYALTGTRAGLSLDYTLRLQ